MVSATRLFMKLMICFVLLCTFIRISNTQPLPNSDDDDEDQTEVYEPLFNNLKVGSGRFASNNPYRLYNPESPYDYHQEQQQQPLYHPNKAYNPADLELAKRIIMLPRVGRRSIRSSSG